MTNDRRLLTQSGTTAGRSGLIATTASTASGRTSAVEYTTFSEFAALLQRSRWTFGAFLLGGAILAAVLAFSQIPMFQARGLVQVEMPNDDFLNRRQLNPVIGPGIIMLEPFLQTQVKLMDSDTMLLSVIDKLHLADHPEFNRKPGVLKRLKQQITHKPTEAATRRSVLGDIRDRLVVRLFGQTQIVEVLFDASDPKLAADVVNALTEGYREKALQRMVGSTSETEDLLSSKIEEQKTALVDAENKLRQFVSSNGLLVSNAEKESFADSRLRQVQSELGTAHDLRIAMQSQYEMVRTASPEALGKMLESDTLKSYRVRLAELKQQLAENSEVLKPAHYKVRQIQAEIDTLQREFEQERAGILARQKTQFESAKMHEDALTQDYDRQARLVANQMGKSIQYNELKRDLEARRALYDSMLRQVKEASVVSALQASNVHIVDPAVAPDTPIRPNKVMYTAIGMAAGSLCGLVFVFATDRRRHNGQVLPSPGRLECNVRLLGRVPTISSPSGDDALLICTDAGAGVRDEFRKLLPQLLYFSQRTARPRIISVTSASHGEGRTFVTCNLAAAIAQAGRKVLVIDADRMNPRVHEIFGVENESGFTDLILQPPGHSGDSVWSTAFPNVFVLPGGRGMARLGSLTNDPRLPVVLDRLCTHFDMILIDTPPVFSDGDAIAIGQQADGVLLVMRPGQAPEELFAASVQQCFKHALPVIGKIINGSETALEKLAS